MARYRADITSPADIDSVFGYLSRFDRAAEWDPGVSSGEMLTPAPVGVGTRYRLVSRVAGRSVPLEYEVVEFDPPLRIVLRARMPLLTSTDTIRFRRDGEGTVVEYDARLEATGPLRLGDPLLALLFRRIGNRAANGLRARLALVPTP